ncbi:hypothetical protein N8739_01535 [Luminiphilus sp.]|nr:hypothetical protein [Luminiphilus sp.]
MIEPATAAIVSPLLHASVTALLKALDTATTDGLRNLLVNELKHNEMCLDMIGRGEVTLECGIKYLTGAVYLKVLASGEKLHKGFLGLGPAKKIKKFAGIKDKTVKKWKGKPAKRLLTCTYDKVSGLQMRYPHSKDQYNWIVRAENCRKRCSVLIANYEH